MALERHLNFREGLAHRLDTDLGTIKFEFLETESFSHLLEAEELIKSFHKTYQVTEQDTRSAKKGDDEKREQIDIQKSTVAITDIKDIIEELKKLPNSGNLLEITKRFRYNNQKLFDSDDYYDYLYFSAIVEGIGKALERKTQALLAKKEKLKTEYEILKTGPSFFRRFIAFVTRSKDPEYIKFERRYNAFIAMDKEVEEARKALVKQYDEFTKIRLEFAEQTNNFPKSFLKNDIVRSLPKFSLDNKTQGHLIRMFDLFMPSRPDGAASASLRKKMDSLKEQWKRQSRFSAFASEPLYHYSDMLPTIKTDLEKAKKSFEEQTKPKGFFTRMFYRVRSYITGKPSPIIPKPVVEKTKAYFAEYEKAVAEDEVAVVESMLARLEALDKTNDLSFDDYTLLHYLNLQNLGVPLPRLTELHGQVGTADELLNSNGSIPVVISHNLKNYDLIIQFLEKIKKFTTENQKNFLATNFRNRMNDLNLFKKPFGWPLEVAKESASELPDDPKILKILMLINTLDKRTGQDLSLLFALDHLDENGNLHHLAATENLITALKQLQTEYSKKLFTSTEDKDLIQYLEPKIREYEKDLQQKKADVLNEVKNAAVYEINRMLNDFTKLTPADLAKLKIKLDRATSFINKTEGGHPNGDYVQETNVIYHLAKHIASYSVPTFASQEQHSIANANFALILETFAVGEEQKKVCKQLLALTRRQQYAAFDYESFENGLIRKLGLPEEDAKEILAAAAVNHVLGYTSQMIRNIAEQAKYSLKKQENDRLARLILDEKLISQPTYTFDRLNLDLQNLKRDVAFIEAHAPADYQSILQDIKNLEYYGSYPDILLEVAVWCSKEPHVITQFGIKRFEYLLANRTQDKGSFTQLDRWFFSEQLKTNPQLRIAVEGMLAETIAAKPEYKGDDSAIRNEELVDLVTSFGSLSPGLITFMNRKIIEGFFTNQQLGAKGKEIIKYYLKALDNNMALYKYETTTQDDIKKNTQTLVQEIINQNKDKIDSTNEVLINLLAESGYVDTPTAQAFRTTVLIDKIKEQFDDYIQGAVPLDVDGLIKKYGEGGTKEIFAALYTMIEKKSTAKEYSHLGSNLIRFIDDLLTPENIAKFDKAKSLQSLMKSVKHEKQVEFIAPEIINILLKLIRDKNYDLVSSVFNALTNHNYKKAFKSLALGLNDEARDKLGLSNKEAIVKLATSFTEHEAGDPAATKLDAQVLAAFKPKLREMVKEVFSVENEGIFFDMSHLERIGKIFDSKRPSANVRTTELSETTNHTQKSKLEIKVEKVRVLLDFLENLNKEINDADINATCDTLREYIKDQDKLYLGIMQAFSPSTQTDANTRYDLAQYITSETVAFICNYFDPGTRDAIVTKISNNMTNTIELEEKSRLAEQQSNPTQTVDDSKPRNDTVGGLDKVTMLALRAFRHAVNDDPSDNGYQQWVNIIEGYSAFHKINQIILQLEKHPLAFNHINESNITLLSEDALKLLRLILRNTDSATNNLQTYYDTLRTYIDKRLQHLIKLGADVPLSQLTKYLGSSEQIAAAEKIATANQNVRGIINILINLQAGKKVDAEQINTLANLVNSQQFANAPAYQDLLTRELNTTLATLVKTQQWTALDSLRAMNWTIDLHNHPMVQNAFDTIVTALKINATQKQLSVEEIVKLTPATQVIMHLGSPQQNQTRQLLIDNLLYLYLTLNGEKDAKKRDSNNPNIVYIEDILKKLTAGMDDDHMLENLFGMDKDRPELFEQKLKIFMQDYNDSHPFMKNIEGANVFCKELEGDIETLFTVTLNKISNKENRGTQEARLNGLIKLIVSQPNISDETELLKAATTLKLPHEMRMLIGANGSSATTFNSNPPPYKFSEIRSLVLVMAAMQRAYESVSEFDNRKTNVDKQTETIAQICQQEQNHHSSAPDFNRLISPDRTTRNRASKDYFDASDQPKPPSLKNWTRNQIF